MTEIRAEAIWAVALSHPLRVRILRRMEHAYGAAPAELAQRWERLGAPLPARERAERLVALASAVESPRLTVLERLRERREQLGLSRTELARRSRIRPDMLGSIERGQTDPRLSLVLVLADELNCPPEDLFGGAAPSS